MPEVWVTVRTSPTGGCFHFWTAILKIEFLRCGGREMTVTTLYKLFSWKMFHQTNSFPKKCDHRLLTRANEVCRIRGNPTRKKTSRDGIMQFKMGGDRPRRRGNISKDTSVEQKKCWPHIPEWVLPPQIRASPCAFHGTYSQTTLRLLSPCGCNISV